MTERFRIEGMTKTHGDRRVLRGIDFAAGEGETVGLIGSNGAGKSTLISIASGAARSQRRDHAPQRPPLPPLQRAGGARAGGQAPCSSASRRLRA